MSQFRLGVPRPRDGVTTWRELQHGIHRAHLIQLSITTTIDVPKATTLKPAIGNLERIAGGVVVGARS